ncbi:hypothetical protein EDD27_9639 [Nonomuraea polychroma]|uniref:Uncharacterized protein n=1 Tax=Nonomuraea polychroma TaxID=46176 RepID=A0A438MLV3_9ACTN|nr:hypothetical protein [Nonomuraea polychroma]RVX46738.1 hypothetical protein EDD27_9639 [Nonomuraea polychroma]
MDAVSLISAAVSVTSAVLTVTLGALFEWRRRHSDREHARRDHVGRYRDPLLQAAAALQARLGNAVRLLSDLPVTEVARDDQARRDEYNRYESLYRFAVYQGWVHILFQEAGFLDLGSRRRNRRLVKLLSGVNGAIAGHDDHGKTGVLQGGEQQVIGELMVVADGSDNGRRRCLGYMEFRAKLDNDREYARRFQPVLAYIDASLAKNPAGGLRRLTAIHNALIDLIDFLDPHRVWVMGRRDRLPLPKEETLAPAEEKRLAPAERPPAAGESPLPAAEERDV